MTGLRMKETKCVAGVIILLVAAVGCGSHKVTGTPSAPASVTLIPSGTTSLQLGSTLTFSATAENSSGGHFAVTITFNSSDTSILNVAPGGVACAGHWDAAFVNCTPGGTGPVWVTASAAGANSASTLVFVHPPIDNVTVTGVLLNGIPVQQPCLSQGQAMTLEAHAFSQGTDVTSSVGPFIWSANNNNSALSAAVVKLTPLFTEIVFNNNVYNIATNQATATAATPGITQIYASASGTTSTSFSQPPPGTNLSFFETCPIQNITLELGHAGSGQTSFAAAKGSGATETVVATVTDVMGNSSLPNTSGGIVLKGLPLTWASSQPAAVGIGTGCAQSCTLSLPSAGAAGVTASCSPPTCNVGFPMAPQGSIPPLPVYAATAISGLVTGTPSSASILASSLGCADQPPQDCSASIYRLGTVSATAGAATTLPFPPNSIFFDPQGDKAYMGSQFGAQIINPGNLGTTASPFTSLGTVTGEPLATSPNGLLAIFSDTIHAPNQVYVTSMVTTTLATTALNISGASAAAFSPDGFEAFIFGSDSNGNPALFVYSTLQALQTACWSPTTGTCDAIPANTIVNSIAFSTNGAFAYAAEAAFAGGGPALSVFNTCDNHISYFVNTQGQIVPQIIPLTAPPIAFKALPDGVHFIALEEGGNIDYISAQITGIPAATLTNPSNTLCPMTVSNSVQSLNLGQGNISPISFFISPDGTLLYVVASDRNDVLIYNLVTTATGVQLIPAGGILLAPTPLNANPTPVSADVSVDAGTIAIAGSDGYLHLLSTALGGSDQAQVSFPDLTNYLNPFCTFTPASGACTLDLVKVRP